MATITEVPGPFDFLGGPFGPPNETMAPEHLAVCVVYGDAGRPKFGSYVVYPSTDRRGPNKSYVIVDDRGRLASSAAFNRAMIHAVQNTTAVASQRRVGDYWHMLPEQSQARKAIWDELRACGRSWQGHHGR
jgi:hypothetical protein